VGEGEDDDFEGEGEGSEGDEEEIDVRLRAHEAAAMYAAPLSASESASLHEWQLRVERVPHDELPAFIEVRMFDRVSLMWMCMAVYLITLRCFEAKDVSCPPAPVVWIELQELLHLASRLFSCRIVMGKDYCCVFLSRCIPIFPLFSCATSCTTSRYPFARYLIFEVALKAWVL
jgi:hypothetical protein